MEVFDTIEKAGGDKHFPVYEEGDYLYIKSGLAKLYIRQFVSGGKFMYEELFLEDCPSTACANWPKGPTGSRSELQLFSSVITVPLF